MKTLWFALVILSSGALSNPRGSQAQAPIRVRLYSSILPGVPESYARSAGQTLPKYLATRIRYEIDFDIESGDTPEQLIAFGKRIDQGHVDLGIVWGIEYGWLKRLYPRLQVAVVAVPLGNSALNSEIRVFAKAAVGNVEELRGGILADYRRAPLADRLFLQKSLSALNETPQTFFKQIKPYETAHEAVHAVRKGEASCIVIGVQSFTRLIDSQPFLEKDLKAIKSSGTLAPAVIIGRPDAVNKKQPGLWDKIVQELTIAHDSAAGKEFNNFWKVEKYTRPDQRFHDLVNASVEQYPMNDLLGVRRGVKER